MGRWVKPILYGEDFDELTVLLLNLIKQPDFHSPIRSDLHYQILVDCVLMNIAVVSVSMYQNSKVLLFVCHGKHTSERDHLTNIK